MRLFFLGCWNEIKCEKDNRAIILNKILNAGYKIGVLGGDNFYPYKVSKKDLELSGGKAKLFRKSTLRPLETLKSRIDDLHVALGNHDLDKLPSSCHPYAVFQYQINLFKDRLYAYPHAGIETYTSNDLNKYIVNYSLSGQNGRNNVKMVFLDLNNLDSCRMSVEILNLAKKQVIDEPRQKSWVLVFAHEPLIVYSPNKVKAEDKDKYGPDFPIASLFIRQALDDLSRGVGELNEVSGGRTLFIAADTHNFQASMVSTPANGNYPLIVCGTGGANPELQLPETIRYPAFDTDDGHHSTDIITTAMPYGYLDIDITEGSIIATYINCNDKKIVLRLQDGDLKLLSDTILHSDNPVESAENCKLPNHELGFTDKLCSDTEDTRVAAFAKGNNLDDSLDRRLSNYKKSMYSKSKKKVRVTRARSRKISNTAQNK